MGTSALPSPPWFTEERVFHPLFLGHLPSNWETIILQVEEGEFRAERAEVLCGGNRTLPDIEVWVPAPLTNDRRCCPQSCLSRNWGWCYSPPPPRAVVVSKRDEVCDMAMRCVSRGA